MLTIDIVSDFIHMHFKDVKVSKNGTHYQSRCQLCGDSKKSKSKRRFNLDFNNGQPIYHCFNCGRSGSFLELYSELEGITIEESKRVLYNYNPDYLIQRLSDRKKEKVIKEIEYENHNYIKDYSITEYDVDKGYINKQYIEKLKDFYRDREIPRKYRLFICVSGEYKGRIIIPIYDEYNNIVYFQARRIPGSDMIPKYMNPTLEKGQVILNKELFKRKSYIIITEGVIDAFMIGDQGTSCMGAEISDNFIKIINKYTDKGIIIALDNDEPGKFSMEKILNNSKYRKVLKYFIIPGDFKDLNEFVVKSRFDKSNLYNFIVSNSYPDYKTKVLLKMR